MNEQYCPTCGGRPSLLLHDIEMNNLRQQVAKLEPALLTDIVGYGYFVDGKLTHCSPTKMQIQIGNKIIECRPLYSVKEMMT